MAQETSGGHAVLDQGALAAHSGLTPSYAAALAICGIAVLYFPPLALVGAVGTGVAGRRRPWVVAAAVVVVAWALLRWAALVFLR
ncbi:hypothetical protein [Isoptericola sp. NPDC057191]|uniref:hypothetical protein n=1 Tax=Isoptericola sp. NPDC057191 TaxID=3346041 RepID=UPI0036420D0A